MVKYVNVWTNCQPLLSTVPYRFLNTLYSTRSHHFSLLQSLYKHKVTITSHKISADDHIQSLENYSSLEKDFSTTQSVLERSAPTKSQYSAALYMLSREQTTQQLSKTSYPKELETTLQSLSSINTECKKPPVEQYGIDYHKPWDFHNQMTHSILEFYNFQYQTHFGF